MYENSEEDLKENINDYFLNFFTAETNHDKQQVVPTKKSPSLSSLFSIIN